MCINQHLRSIRDVCGSKCNNRLQDTSATAPDFDVLFIQVVQVEICVRVNSINHFEDIFKICSTYCRYRADA